MKRGSSGLSFCLGINKPAGITSHDVINQVRSKFQEKRVGHAGTLDPAATGVLPIMVGSAARLSNFLMGHNKTYVATIKFGEATDTFDGEGDIVSRMPVSDNVFDECAVCDYLQGIVGTQMQTPPAYSAIKVGGKKSCDEVHKGRHIDLPAREIEILSANLLGVDLSEKTWKVEFCVSAGTYIRCLARDAGLHFGTCSHLQSLCRTEAANISLDKCVCVDDAAIDCALDPAGLLGFEVAHIDAATESLAYDGKIIPNKTGVKGEFASVVCEDRFVGIYTPDGAYRALIPHRVFLGGVYRGPNC